MSHRSFAKRREERYDRLVDRAQWLSNRLCRPELTDGQRRQTTTERSAVLWALEEIDRLDEIEDVLDSSLSEGEQLLRIETICESRTRPTDADRQRTPQLARQE